MDIFSILIFFIYIILVLMVLIYISPVFSVIVLFLLPAISVFFLPVQTMGFFSIVEFSFLEGTLVIQNIHVMLLIWSSLIGVVAYSEFISWYLSREEKSQPEVGKLRSTDMEKVAAEPAPLKSAEAKKTYRKRMEELLLKLGKIMSGGK